MTPEVSVIIPLFEARAYVAEAIQSVLAQEDAPRLEIVVVDDGSTDGGGECAAAFGAPVRCIRTPNGGIGAARNRGVAEARGDLLAFLDADDRWLPDKLRLQVARLAAEPDLAMVFGHSVNFAHVAADSTAQRTFTNSLRPTPGFLASTMLIRRSALDLAGPFNVQWRVGEFIDWFARAKDAGLRYAMLPELVHERRLHDSNTGIRERQNLTDYATILKQTLDRRRLASGSGGAEVPPL